MWIRWLWAVLMTAGIAGCQAQPTQEYRKGEVLLEETFERASAWETYLNPKIGADFQVIDDIYRARTGSDSFMWGLNAQLHTDVVIEVQTRQLGENSNNAYGVMCRADPSNDSDGYYFIISGDGFWSIRRGARDEVKPLIEFSRSGAIHQGKSINTIRAVCIGDYLALYINDQFAGETRDDLYQRGVAGLTVAAAGGDAADIAFDNLTITAGALK